MTLRKKNQASEADDGEGEVGGDIGEVGDAEPSTLVGEVVIGQRLRDGWKQKRDNADHCRNSDQ
jgi:hypothetical protein